MCKLKIPAFDDDFGFVYFGSIVPRGGFVVSQDNF